MNYDIIGDIHGQNEKLEALLKHLGYKNKNGSFRHPDRKAVFVGDFIDRGPGQIKTLNIVRNMIDSQSALAVMGNHEFNALAYFYKNEQGNHLRERTEKNTHQHAAFLSEVGIDSPLHKEWVDWFMTLPLWLELDDVRIVHACWHDKSMNELNLKLNKNQTLTKNVLLSSSIKGHEDYNAVETLCKGLEIDLPNSVFFVDKQGTKRNKSRVKWWDEKAITYRDSTLVGELANLLPATPLPLDAMNKYDNKKPVFFGHYWLSGAPSILSDKICCVDYSAAINDEPLVAYRYDGETDLSNDKLIAVKSKVEPVVEIVENKKPKIFTCI